MNTKMLIPALAAALIAGAASAQTATQTASPRQDTVGVREPPPQAYEDCRGKKSGETVQHTTREGKVAATCADSPKGMVARPNQPQGAQNDAKAR